MTLNDASVGGTEPDDELRSASIALTQLLDRVRDPEIGLIRYLAEIPAQPSEPGIHIAVAEFQDPFLVPPRSLAGPGAKAVTQGTGAGLSRIDALWSAVGEAIERYSIHVYDEESLIYAPAVALDGDHLSPRDLILFSDEQYALPNWPFRRFDPTTTIGWCHGTRLSTGSKAYIPASLTYLGYSRRTEFEAFDAGYSTGAAVGRSFAEATLSGLLEVIERDSFACHWYLRRRPSYINRDDLLDALPVKLARMLGEASLRLELVDITTDLGIPAALAIGRVKDGFGVPIGACARPVMKDAATKAAIEAFHTFNWILELRRGAENPPLREDIHSYRDHVRYYMNPENAVLTEFLMRADGDQRLYRDVLGTPSQRLDHLVRHLRMLGHECYSVDITPEEVQPLGICAVKTFITGLHPLGCGSDRAHHDQRRLRSFAKALGTEVPFELNTDPHPFP